MRQEAIVVAHFLLLLSEALSQVAHKENYKPSGSRNPGAWCQNDWPLVRLSFWVMTWPRVSWMKAAWLSLPL